MRQRDDMTFPFEEYQRRLEDLRTRIAKRNLDAVVITAPENIMYLTDYQTTGYSFFQALVVPLEDDPFMITRYMESSNIVARTWVERMRPFPDTGDAIQMLVDAMREFGLDIRSPKVQTLGPEAVDTFYLCDRSGGKITDPAVLAELELALRDVMGGIDD